MKLLFAEDDRDISRAVSTVLKSQKYTVDTVFTGTGAYAYASQGNYDGIILDIMMPGIDGLEVLRRLRREGVQTPVLLLTAKAELEDRVAGLAASKRGFYPRHPLFSRFGAEPEHF